MGELLTLLAASAPQLQTLEHYYPPYAPMNPAAALPAAIVQLSLLTSLTLDFGGTPVSAEQVDDAIRTLPAVQHLVLLSTDSASLMEAFPSSILTTCSLLQHLEVRCGWSGEVPPTLGRLTQPTHLTLNRAGFTSLRQTPSRCSQPCESSP